MQKKACKVIHNLSLNIHSTEYFKNATILKLTDLYASQMSMIKCLNVNANILSSKHSDIHNYYTSNNNNNFIAPKYNTKKSKMSINFKSINVWNKLPTYIHTSDSLNIFMDNLRNYCLSLY